MTVVQCRVCLNYSSNCRSLFNQSRGVCLSQMILFCTGVHIAEDDGLPSHGCAKCCQDVTLAYRFIHKCRKSDTRLRTQQIDAKPSEAEDTDASTVESEEANEAIDYGTEPSVLRSKLFKVEALLDPPEDLCFADSYEELDHGDDDGDASGTVTYATEYLEEENPDQEVQTDQHRDQDQRSVFCCDFNCVRQFNTQTELRLHMAFQHSIGGGGQARSDALHRCSNCDQHFGDAEALSIHLKQLQLKHSILAAAQTARQQVHPNLFSAPVKKCCGCLQSFPSLEALLQHTEQQHSIRKMARDPSRPAQCEICYKLFRCHRNVRFHQRVVYQPCNYRCELCDRQFTTANKLSRHQITHDENRRFGCAVCGATFKIEQNLKMHSLVHQEEKREVCKTCGLRFRRKSNLRMHQRTHSDTYYHACAHCGRQYKNKSQLSEHLKVHTKERPYPCRFCEKRFMYYSDWKRHETTHTGQYPYVCACSKQFIRKNRYTQHVGKCKASVEASLDNETEAKE